MQISCFYYETWNLRFRDNRRSGCMILPKTPTIITAFPSSLIWKLSRKEKKLYLTFDDGPTPEITQKILEILKEYEAKATFFCLGKNVIQNPGIYNLILEQGHATGNHTHTHLNGWKTRSRKYFEDINQASGVIQSNLFRPPYGRLKTKQILRLKSDYKIIMWEILSGDYSKKISPEKCTENVISNAQSGSIIVFHDSEKAKKNVLFALPRVLEHFSGMGFAFDIINSSVLKR